MISLSTETVLSLQEGAKITHGRNGRSASFSTLWRWVLKGVRGPDGKRVRLRASRVGGKWVTSTEALEEFSRALTPSFNDTEDAPSPRTPGRRDRAAARAEAELEGAGI